MFVDRTRIRVTGGSGGNGCCSFRREKYVPRGGPDGGDGGKGGDVYFVADARCSSLADLHYHSHWKGEAGGHGTGSDCHGKNGKDVQISVPPGTVLRCYSDHSLVVELLEPAQRLLVARGGQGGKGNARFANSTNRAPRFAELGEPGEDAEYLLELKLIAEVGIVGLPNAGKSTFLAAATAAKPKIADYPFTTLYPNLGVAHLSRYRTLILADIPGIIEGAAEGKGLGHDFLRHIERTKVLLFIIDLGDQDPTLSRHILESELARYSPVLVDRPRVFALNKADIPENRERFQRTVAEFPNALCISAATGNGVQDVLERLWEMVESARQSEMIGAPAPPAKEYVYEAPFVIEKAGDGFRVAGKAVVRAVRMTNFDNEEAIRHLHRKLTKMGLFHSLRRLGAQDGQTITIGDIELVYQADQPGD
ncbi:MAG: GTPase ObgE [Candidatus Hydrogenedentes bacterium]|nr:GTPase ObgE [Candidatus Hydrogenedentota bacterium]